MADDILIDVSNDGIIAGHPDRISRPKFVAPSTGGEFNTIEPLLITVGCALVPDHQFAFGSSFIKPQAKGSFQKLVQLLKSKPDCPISVFGHADPVGKDSFNKVLSGRRAMAVYAILVRDTELWEKQLYKKSHGSDVWGVRSLQIILNHLGYSPGEITGRMNQETGDAVAAFQQAETLGVDRDPGPITRDRLFLLYMDDLCSDASGQSFQVGIEKFLAQGVDSKGKGDYQGCSEFNPVLIFSEEEQNDFNDQESQDARNEANAPNRRVLIFLFRPGTHVSPDAWPCPRALEGDSGCKKRFWSNGEARRYERQTKGQRQFQETEDTFACRFYHGLAKYSPCEAILKLWCLRIQVDGPNGKLLDLANRRFVLIAGDVATAPTMRGRTDERGIMRIPVYSEFVTMTLKLEVSGYLFEPQEADVDSDSNGSEDDGEESTTNQPPAGEAWEDEGKFWVFILNGGELVSIDEPGYNPALQRLLNLGYGIGDPEEWDDRMKLHAIKSFQRKHELEESGAVTADTRDAIRKAYGS